MSRLLKEREVAERIGMSVHWLRRKRVVGGGIPFIKMGDGGGRGPVRYDEEDVETFKRSCVRTSTSQG